MKIKKILGLLLLLAIASSCSKDDDPKPSNLETASISFSKDKPVVEVPAALSSSDDTHAQMAAGWISSVNAMTTNLSMFTPPSGAVKSTTPITPANGRSQATQKEYLVYVWTDANYGSVAYQISEESDKYVFELFFKASNQTEWYRYLYAYEKKDRSSGQLIVYNLFGILDLPKNAVVFKYEWTRSGDNFDFVFTDALDDFKITLNVNTKTKAGSIKYYYESEVIYEMTWDAQGNGTWKYYNEDGTVEDGVWTA